MAEMVTLEFLCKQFELVFGELAAIRDEQCSIRGDLTVSTSIVLRHDATVKGILAQLHALTTQHSRFDARLRCLEGGGTAAGSLTCGG